MSPRDLEMTIVPTVGGQEWAPAVITHYTVTPRKDLALEVQVTLAKRNPNLSRNMRGGKAMFICGPAEAGDQAVIMCGAYKVFDSRTHMQELL